MIAHRTLRRVAQCAAVAGISGIVAAPALAQDNPNVPVTERSRPEFDPLGIRTGSYFWFPALTVSAAYDDNVFATPDDEDDDFVTLIQPGVRLVSNLPRHSLNASVGADIGIYANEDTEDFEDFFAEVGGEYEITRRNSFLGEVFGGRFHEGRDDPEDRGGIEPTKFWRYGGDLRFRQVFNRLNFQVRGRARRFQFEDTGALSNEDRDRIEYDGFLRGGYLISPRINTFVEGRGVVKDYDNDDILGRDRSSYGWEVRGGAEVDFTAVLFGEAFVGYRQEFFDDDAFGDEDGISFGSDLTWNVTGLTTLTLIGGADFESTTDVGASSRFRSAIALSVDHELLRNLLIGANVGYLRDDFRGEDRVDNRIDAGAGITYLVNRYLALEAEYAFSDRSSDDPLFEFTRNRVRVGVTGRL